MSGRNYSPNEGLLGKFREDFEVPHDMPEVNTDGLLALQAWRTDEYEKPILDDILAWYRFDPITPETAKKYVGEPRQRAVGREAVKKMLANKDEVIAAGQRQVVHIAENTEEVLATFWMIAQGRQTAVEQALSSIIKEEPMNEETAHHAAEAIEDMGHCLYQPFEPKFEPGKKKKIVPDETIVETVEYLASGVGVQAIEFGKFAADNHDALRTNTGIILLQSALEEQQYRIDAWWPRHEAIREAFPEINLSMDILLERIPLEELIDSQRNFDKK